MQSLITPIYAPCMHGAYSAHAYTYRSCRLLFTWQLFHGLATLMYYTNISRGKFLQVYVIAKILPQKRWQSTLWIWEASIFHWCKITAIFTTSYTHDIVPLWTDALDRKIRNTKLLLWCWIFRVLRISCAIIFAIPLQPRIPRKFYTAKISTLQI